MQFKPTFTDSETKVNKDRQNVDQGWINSILSIPIHCNCFYSIPIKFLTIHFFPVPIQFLSITIQFLSIHFFFNSIYNHSIPIPSPIHITTPATVMQKQKISCLHPGCCAVNHTRYVSVMIACECVDLCAYVCCHK